MVLQQDRGFAVTACKLILWPAVFCAMKALFRPVVDHMVHRVTIFRIPDSSHCQSL